MVAAADRDHCWCRSRSGSWARSGVIAAADRDDFVDWLSGPVAAILMLLFLGATFYHLKLGLQVVIEDYVHGKCKWVLLILNTLLCLVLCLASLYSVILIAVQG